jgi:hypothetical protein
MPEEMTEIRIVRNKRSSFKQFFRNTNNKNKLIIGVSSFLYPSYNESYSSFFERLKELAHSHRCDYKVFVENLDIVKWLRKIYPNHARNILFVENNENIQSFLLEKKYESIIVTSDQIFYDLYLFENKSLQTLPEFPIPESLISCIADGDFSFFIEHFIPQNGFVEAKKLFNFIRELHNLSPINSTRKDINIETKSKNRDKYIKGKLFSLNEIVKCKNELYQIEHFGPNYIVVRNVENNKKEKQWIEDVIKISG